MLTYYSVVYHICQFTTGGHIQKARPVEVLTHSQGNLEEKGKPTVTNTGQIIMHICMNETHNNKYTVKSTLL